jgi:spore maturation protein SpmA
LVKDEGVLLMPKARNKKKTMKAILLLVGALGIILFWRGIWTFADQAHIIQDPLISVVIGVILLIISHQWYREL